jgi:hypothetical protein
MHFAYVVLYFAYVWLLRFLYLHFVCIFFVDNFVDVTLYCIDLDILYVLYR